MKTKLDKSVAVLAMLFLAPTSMAQADLLDGETLYVAFFTVEPFGQMRTISAEGNTVVGPGTELMNFGSPAGLGFVDVDFSDTNVLITSRSDRLGFEFAHFSFSDSLHMIPGFYSVTVDPATNMPDDSYHVNLIDLDAVGISFRAGGLEGKQLSLDLTMIPEPSAACLTVMAVAFLVTRRRRF